MNTSPDNESIKELVDSLCNLIKVLIYLFPEGVDEKFDEDSYLTILNKSERDAQNLKALISRAEGKLRETQGSCGNHPNHPSPAFYE